MGDAEARRQIDGFLAGYELQINRLERVYAIKPSPRTERALERLRHYLTEMLFWQSLLEADTKPDADMEDARLN